MKETLISSIKETFYHFTNINVAYFDFKGQVNGVDYSQHVDGESLEGLRKLEEIAEGYKGVEEGYFIINENLYEKYIVKISAVPSTSGLYICGPFLTKKPRMEDIKMLKKSYDLNMSLKEIQDYYNHMKLVSQYYSEQMIVLLNALVKAEEKDFKVLKRVELRQKEKYSECPKLDEISTFENWKKGVNINSIRYNDEFYEKMFQATSEGEFSDVLIKYYFISEPFENIYGHFGSDELRGAKNLVIISGAFAFKYALNYGIELTNALNILIFYMMQVEKATSKKDVLQLRTGMLKKYYQASRSNRSKDENPLITHIKEYIHLNLNKQILLADIGDALGYNKEYISHQFKLHTGQTIVSYIHQSKVEQGKSILLNSTDKIYDVSSYLGFTNVSSFIRVFKKMTGYTPSEFRKRENRNKAKNKR